MISAVDSSILLDIFTKDPAHGNSSRELLKQAYNEGAMVISDVVYAEIAPQFATQQELDSALRRLTIRLVDSGTEVAYLAGRKWAEYRKAGGSRARLLPDFLVGAHAQLRADRLITRDRGFYRTYFTELCLLER